jgi:GNAT superfamily N-acetyltransferase
MSPAQSWRIRPANSTDRAFLEHLAPRLTVGLASWRDKDAMLATARHWLLADLDRMGHDCAVFIVESPIGEPVGAATIARSQHFTGTPQAELGELAVVGSIEGQGAASALLAAAEAWAREHDLPFVSLGTGSANTRARAFYARHGYLEEDVRLAKRV